MTTLTAQTTLTSRTEIDWVSTTLESIARESVDSLTVSSLCTAAGISRPTFYSRFGNVDGLLAEVWLENGNAWLDSLVSEEYVADARSRSMAHILAVARRKPELNEVVSPIIQRWWRKIEKGGKTIGSAWLIANRLGVSLLYSVDPGVQAISALDPVISELMSQSDHSEWSDSQASSRLALTTPKTGDLLLDAAIAVIATAGYQNASMSRIGRYANLTTGAIYPHFNTTEDLLYSAFARAQRLIVEQNSLVWNELGFSVRNFGEFIVSGLVPERSLWRNLRLETVLAATSNERISQSALESLVESAEALQGVVSRTDLPEEFKPVVHYLFHSLGVGFGVLHDVTGGVENLPHVDMAERLGAALRI